MKPNKRLDELEAAHRALAARSEALFQVCKVTLPIALASQPHITCRLLTVCYDATNDHMDRLDWDEDMQTQLRDALDELSAVLVCADTPASHPS